MTFVIKISLFTQEILALFYKAYSMQKIIISALIVTTLLGCSQNQSQKTETPPPVTLQTIAFGSCGHQSDPQPVLERIAEKHPDLFLYLGDNIYSDTYSMDTLRKNYAILGAKPEFQKLKASTPILATWDDHDFGWNDSGRHYPYKEESKKIFLDFFGVPDSAVLNHKGIYYSKIIADAPKTVQLIMLDMRTFRDKLLPYNGSRKNEPGFQYELDYSPYTTADSTMLGKEQWQWLEEQLRTPADVRIIGSSTQFGITHNGYEAWANFPHEQQKMIDLIKTTKANGVLFLSGDVHYAELSKIKQEGVYPLYDLTASGITSTWDFATPNDNRIAGAVMENHFGLITFDWAPADPLIKLQIIDVKGQERISHSIKLSELQF
jgi:alkaline phosphatase D